MEPKFWRERWEQNSIAFHLPEPNPQLVKHLRHLELAPGSRILVPLCGKSVDLPWLASQGFRVVGVELSRLAVDQFFAELKLAPTLTDLGGGVLKLSAGPIDIWAADFFEVSQEKLGPVDAVYDRAALVALPKEMRARYVAHLSRITGAAAKAELLVAYEYDQEQMPGPPFSVPAEEVRRHYERDFEVREIDRAPVAGGLKGVPAQEVVWLLKRRAR